MQRSALILLCLLGNGFWSGLVQAQPDDFHGAIAGPRAVTLCLPVRGVPSLAPLPKKSKLVSLDELQLTGPMPSHPFVLGNFAADGRWGLVRGIVGVVEGKNAVLQLAWAGDFELEGIIEQTGLGGCFWLLGWNEGRGFALHNSVMKNSGSPWFISEFRGSKAIEDRTRELEKFEWRGEQPFRLSVQEQTFSLTVGRFHVFNREPIEGYQPGRLIFGVYDTRYGPKAVRIKTLKIREIDPGIDPPVSTQGKSPQQ